MNKMFFVFLVLAGCGDGLPEEETFVFHDVPTCWTVDGDPEVYVHVPTGMSMDEELQLFCENLKEVALERSYK